MPTVTKFVAFGTAAEPRTVPVSRLTWPVRALLFSFATDGFDAKTRETPFISTAS